MAKSASITDPKAVLAAAATQPAPVYLLVGEPFQTESVAHSLIEVLVPPERRSFNLETYDGRTTAIGPVLDSLRTRGLFPGTKLVWVREPTLFVAGEKRADVSDALFTAWAEERQSEAAERLLVLAALAGWSQEDFAAANWRQISASDLQSLLGRAAGERERDTLVEVHALCLERNFGVGAYRDESGMLEEYLRGGPPADAVLLFTASAVDGRKRVVKKIAEGGGLIELKVARERSGALAAESVDELIERILGEHGKRLAPAARRAVAQRAGADPALLAAELEKVCLYAGEADEISTLDVETCMRDLGESWIFDFTRALAQRQAAPAVLLLRGLFAQGEHPLRLLAMIARELRLLLLARDCLTGSLAGEWTPRTQFATFRDRLLGRLSAAEKEAIGGLHPFALFQALHNAGRTNTIALQRALLALQQLDVKLKSSNTDPRLALEAYVLAICSSNPGGSRAPSAAR
jgi:DNA polymerase III subunit delta